MLFNIKFELESPNEIKIKIKNIQFQLFKKNKIFDFKIMFLILTSCKLVQIYSLKFIKEKNLKS